MAYNYDWRNGNLHNRDMEIGTRVKSEFNTKYIPSIYDGAIYRGDEEVCCVVAYEKEVCMGELNVYVIAAYDWDGNLLELSDAEEKSLVAEIENAIYEASRD